MIGRRRFGSASANRPWALVPALFTRMSRPPNFVAGDFESAAAILWVRHVAHDCDRAASATGDFGGDGGELFTAAGQKN